MSQRCMGQRCMGQRCMGQRCMGSNHPLLSTSAPASHWGVHWMPFSTLRLHLHLHQSLTVTPPPLSLQVCHSPELLTVSVPRLAARVRRVRRALQASGPGGAWDEEWRRLSPAQRADCLLASTTTLHRLEYLLLERQVRGECGEEQHIGVQ